MTRTLPFSALALALISVVPHQGQVALAQDSAVAAPDGNLNPLSAIDPASLTGFRDRPLFAPSRQRPQDVTAPEPETTLPVDEPVELRLLGIVSTPEGAIARILDNSDNTGHSLRKGETVKDWTVVAISAADVTLAKGEETQTLSIFKQSAMPGFAGIGPQELGEAPPSDGLETTEPPRDVRIVPMAR